ncbi:MAG: YhdH/YhfP family quinone oxidoreductase [Pseudomonadales bacterium]|nr:YhdH/YhfP family quinone oxidoreductase [Pseudomonadales bacterium]
MEYRALLVSEAQEKQFTAQVTTLDTDNLPAGEVLIEVQYSSLNYKDALSASGNRGVTREYPHTPGIDAAGIVRESANEQFSSGDEVIVIGYDLGMNTAGGFGQFIRVPAGWVVRKPKGLALRDSMCLGTAGFTAALCVDKLLAAGLEKDHGEVLVTGATGGVGVVAIALLSKLGFQVVASTGKPQASDWLRDFGAADIIDRAEMSEENKRPLLKERWAAAVDVAGGNSLLNILKTLRYGGSVAACGLVESPVFQASVLPFILRSVNLLGVDSVELPIERKQAVWDKLSSEWQLESLEKMVTEIGFDELAASLDKVLKGQAQGRYLLNLQS